MQKYQQVWENVKFEIWIHGKSLSIEGGMPMCFGKKEKGKKWNLNE